MRTTVDLPESVLRDAKRLARERGTTVRALIEQGLRLLLKQQQSEAFATPYRLPDRSFGEGGLVEGLSAADWSKIRDISYEGRGA